MGHPQAMRKIRHSRFAFHFSQIRNRLNVILGRLRGVIMA
jgi:hypothetical protein